LTGGVPNVAEKNILILVEENKIWFRVFVIQPNVEFRKKNSAMKKMNILTLELSGKKILNFQQIGNWIRWTISQRKTITYFVRNSGCENKETLSSQYNRNRTPYSTPAISTSYSPLQNDLLLDEELVWIDHVFNS
jgi:hypothetical protein